MRRTPHRLLDINHLPLEELKSSCKLMVQKLQLRTNGVTYDTVQAMLVPLCKPEQLKKRLFQISLWANLRDKSYVAVHQPPGGTNPEVMLTSGKASCENGQMNNLLGRFNQTASSSPVAHLQWGNSINVKCLQKSGSWYVRKETDNLHDSVVLRHSRDKALGQDVIGKWLGRTKAAGTSLVCWLIVPFWALLTLLMGSLNLRSHINKSL